MIHLDRKPPNFWGRRHIEPIGKPGIDDRCNVIGRNCLLLRSTRVHSHSIGGSCCSCVFVFFVFCRPLLVVVRFSISRVYLFPLTVDHWPSLRFSFLFVLIWWNEALEMPNQCGNPSSMHMSHTGRDSEGHSKIETTQHNLTLLCVSQLKVDRMAPSLLQKTLNIITK